LTEEGVAVPKTLAELVDRADALLFACHCLSRCFGRLRGDQPGHPGRDGAAK
jgi:hypothetical protein